jgi:hypothetical protein
MSTQFYTTDPQAPYQQISYQQAPNPQATGPSWFRIWAVVIGTALTAVVVVLCLAVWHGHSSAAPATTGPSTSTSVPAHPATPPVSPAHPTTPPVAPTGSAG